MRQWLVPAVVAMLLAAAGCGDGSRAGPASGEAADVRQERSDHSLTGAEWQLTTVVGPSRTWSPPPEVDAVLRFDGEGHFSARRATPMAGDELRLDKPDGRGLRFRVRDTIYPSRELRPLLQDAATVATTGSAGRPARPGSAIAFDGGGRELGRSHRFTF